MDTEEKMLRMFEKVYGPLSNRFTLDIIENDDYEPKAIKVMKGSNECWSVTKEDLLFEYVTILWGNGEEI